jgi:hypothetical protein
MTRIAQCHCGQVTITCEGDPDPVVMCSCRSCQRRTGAPFQIGAWFPIDAVRIDGETRAFVSVRDSGRESTVNFCPNCGTSIWWEGYLGKIGVAGGCFADPDFPPPTISVYEQTKHPWIKTPDGVKHYEKMTPIGPLETK